MEETEDEEDPQITDKTPAPVLRKRAKPDSVTVSTAPTPTAPDNEPPAQIDSNRKEKEDVSLPAAVELDPMKQYPPEQVQFVERTALLWSNSQARKLNKRERKRLHKEREQLMKWIQPVTDPEASDSEQN